MNSIQSQLSNKSSVRSDEPLFVSQDLSDSSEPNENQMKSSKQMTNSQSTDQIGVRKSTQLGKYAKQMSQTLLNRTEEWKGSQVLNYKTFKKVLQNSSQTCDERKVVSLKRVKIDFNENLSSNETNNEMTDKPLDSEKSNKRKIDQKVETISESGAKKKSRR